MSIPARKISADFDPEALRLFDQYVHGGSDEDAAREACKRMLALFERTLRRQASLRKSAQAVLRISVSASLRCAGQSVSTARTLRTSSARAARAATPAGSIRMCSRRR
jgi:hypothetical protein